MPQPLNYSTQHAYYGLRVEPTFEQVLGTARKPLNIPVPDRKYKWYALGPYRSFILDAEAKYNDHEHSSINFRQAGHEVPEAAARVQPSAAGADPAFDQIHAHGVAMDAENARNVTRQLMHDEQSRKTEHNRSEHLYQTYGPNLGDPTIQAAFDELDAAQVYHSKPAPRPVPIKSYYLAPVRHFVATGQPQAPQFMPFGELNLGDPHRVRPAKPTPGQSSDYETLKEAVKDA